MAFPVLNKPYRYGSGDYIYIVIFRWERERDFTYLAVINSESVSGRHVLPLLYWGKESLQKNKHLFTPMFKTIPVESDPEYEETFV